MTPNCFLVRGEAANVCPDNSNGSTVPDFCQYNTVHYNITQKLVTRTMSVSWQNRRRGHMAGLKSNSKIHRIWEKRGHSILGITLTNLDVVSYFLARIILILHSSKTLENLAQHCNNVTWR